MSDKRFACEKCAMQFKSRSGLWKHQQKAEGHTLQKRVNKTLNCASGNCQEQFATLFSLVNHVELSHGIKIDEEHLTFDNFEEFETWRLNYEKENDVRYVTFSGSKTQSSKQVYTFYCNRSGDYRVRTQEGRRKRRLKRQGSCKLNAYCTAHIKADHLDSGRVHVRHWKTHFGHEHELGHITLSKVDKAEFAGKLMQGVPTDKLLDNVRETVKSDLKREHLMNKKDLEENVVPSTSTQIPVYKLNTCIQEQEKLELIDTVASHDNTSTIGDVQKKIIDDITSITRGIKRCKDLEILHGIKKHLKNAKTLLTHSSMSQGDTNGQECESVLSPIL